MQFLSKLYGRICGAVPLDYAGRPRPALRVFNEIEEPTGGSAADEGARPTKLRGVGLKLAAVMLASISPAEIIDRIAVTVERRVITESEIMRQLRITAFLNGEKPDFSLAGRRAMADRLVEQVLIRRELETSGYAASERTTAANYQQMKARFKTEEAYKLALAQYGITDDDVREALNWQAALLEFVDQRFRPGVQIPESEIREYYDQQVAQNPGKLPPYEEAKEDIQQILTSQRVDNALDRWLGQARTQARMRYRDEVFK